MRVKMKEAILEGKKKRVVTTQKGKGKKGNLFIKKSGTWGKKRKWKQKVSGTERGSNYPFGGKEDIFFERKRRENALDGRKKGECVSVMKAGWATSA